MPLDAGSPLSGGALLGLMWLASPALPVGGFSYSEGLEAAVAEGLVHDEVSAAAWLEDQLHVAQARGDLPALVHAHAAWERHDGEAAREVNDWVLQTRETRELRLQTEQMGRSLADWVAQRSEPGDPAVDLLRALPPAPSWPVAFALAGLRTGAAARKVALACAFGWAENQVQAAIKSIPLGQSAGQRILARLAAGIPEAVEHALRVGPDERLAFSPGLAWLSARHEQQYSRLFRS
jgi:urease accessory protein